MTVSEWFQNVPLLTTSHDHVWVRTLGLASTSTDQSLPKNGALRIGLYRNAGQFVSGSSKGWLYQKCCDGLRVVSVCFSPYKKVLTGMGKNGRPCFHLNWPIFPQEWSPKIWLYWNAGQFISSSSARWLYQRCCDDQIGLPKCSFIPITNLYQFLVRMVGLASASIDHSPSTSGPIRLGWCWNAGQFMSGFSTRWLYQSQRCCDGLVWECIQGVQISKSNF